MKAPIREMRFQICGELENLDMREFRHLEASKPFFGTAEHYETLKRFTAGVIDPANFGALADAIYFYRAIVAQEKL